MSVEKPNRHEKRRQRTREAIVAAAAAAFLRKGVADTTVADITEAADVGYGTFYNHFHGLNDVVSAVAEATLTEVVQIALGILPDDYAVELAGAICGRVIMRVLSRDPAIRWLLEEPYVFVDEWHKTVTPFMREVEQRGLARGQTPPAVAAIGGIDTWIRLQPWILICELNDAIEKGSSASHEENLAEMALRAVGVGDGRRAAMVEESRKIVEGAQLPPARRGKPVGKRTSGRAAKAKPITG